MAKHWSIGSLNGVKVEQIADLLVKATRRYLETVTPPSINVKVMLLCILFKWIFTVLRGVPILLLDIYTMLVEFVWLHQSIVGAVRFMQGHHAIVMPDEVTNDQLQLVSIQVTWSYLVLSSLVLDGQIETGVGASDL